MYLWSGTPNQFVPFECCWNPKIVENSFLMGILMYYEKTFHKRHIDMLWESLSLMCFI